MFDTLTRGHLVLIIGPSGAGKTTLYNHLLENYSYTQGVIGATTRAPRDGEADGVDYHFLALDKAREYIKADMFLEHAVYHGNIYGTLRSEIDLTQPKVYLNVIERQGMRKLKRLFDPRDVTTIMIIPPDMETLVKRLQQDSTRTPESIANRLLTAQSEISDRSDVDYVYMNDGAISTIEIMDYLTKERLC